MKRLVILFIVSSILLGLAGCSKEEQARPPERQESQPSTRPAESTPSIDATAPSKQSYILGSGDNLWYIGQCRYGNRHYSKVIVIYNRITDTTKLPVGMAIKTPDLKTILLEEGLSPMSEEIDLILKARVLYMKIEDRLSAIQRQAGYEQMILPEGIRQNLLSAADCVDKAIAGFSRERSLVAATPRKLIGQLRSLSLNLRNLATGANDGYGYDLDMVHQRLVYAMVNGIKWARNGYR